MSAQASRAHQDAVIETNTGSEECKDCFAQDIFCYIEYEFSLFHDSKYQIVINFSQRLNFERTNKTLS